MKKNALILLATVVAFGMTLFAAGPKKKMPARNAEKDRIMQQVKDSLNDIKKAADAGDHKAQCQVGNWYYTGNHVPVPDYNKAYEYWKKAADAKNVTAIGNLGLCYRYGRGVERDSVKAISQFLSSIVKGNTPLLEQQTRLADGGDLFSCILLGQVYADGKLKDPAKALAYYTMGSDRGDVNSVRSAGLYLLNNKKGAEAIKYFEKGADLDDPACIYFVGRMLRDGGMGVKSDPQKGIQYLMRAADKDFLAAYYQLGQAYLKGLGVAPNVDQASKYYRRAAVRGDVNSAFALARILSASPAQYDRAIEWFAVSAPKRQGAFKKLFQPSDTTLAGTDFDKYIRAMEKYSAGEFEQAAKLFKALEKSVPGAKTMQGIILLNKKNPKMNVKKGVKILESMAKKGDARAATILGQLYLAGTGVKKDDARGLELLQQGAAAFDPQALCAAGDIYYEGLYGVERNLDKAVECYLAAGPLISEKSAKYLSDCYANGYGGLEKNRASAEDALKRPTSRSVTAFMPLLSADAPQKISNKK